ncbi:hypothetical protein NO2_1639 [Candidatus Termititenax persephonae]|uniref:Uncharacterized protein n=1 Tax=Candidatus Termititenax persephonae TaxID=2218525 RepID=A0A388TIW5_9BACT|nr:hypothetical protein NO2_1639 [Candidatus Termititenax persephonae]
MRRSSRNKELEYLKIIIKNAREYNIQKAIEMLIAECKTEIINYNQALGLPANNLELFPF